MEKVKVTKEVADALCDRLKWITPWEIVETSVRNGWDERGRNNCGCLNKRNLHLDTLIKALYIGYEVDKTPEEKVAELYLEAHNETVKSVEHKGHDRAIGVMTGITFTLDTLGIKIKGVNA